MSHRRGPVTHHPERRDLELTRREGLKGLTEAQDPAPKGLDPLTTFMLGRVRNETASRVEKESRGRRPPNTNSQNKDAHLRRGIWNWKSGTKGVPADICP